MVEHAQIVTAIKALVPAANYALNGDNYDEMMWEGPGEKPALKTILDKVAALEALPAPSVAEIDEEEINKLLLQDGSIVRAIAEILFIMGNDIRLLKGQATLTKQQYIDFLRTRMRT